MIKSKHINFETKTTNPCPLLSRILNSKSLSKELYQQFMPSELDFDTIRGLSKWRSQLETDIYFENVFVTYLRSLMIISFRIFSINYYTESCPQILFCLKLESKILICVAFVKLLQILLCITFGNVLKSKNAGNK